MIANSVIQSPPWTLFTKLFLSTDMTTSEFSQSNTNLPKLSTKVHVAKSEINSANNYCVKLTFVCQYEPLCKGMLS